MFQRSAKDRWNKSDIGVSAIAQENQLSHREQQVALSRCIGDFVFPDWKCRHRRRKFHLLHTERQSDIKRSHVRDRNIGVWATVEDRLPCSTIIQHNSWQSWCNWLWLCDVNRKWKIQKRSKSNQSINPQQQKVSSWVQIFLFATETFRKNLWLSVVVTNFKLKNNLLIYP